VDFIKLIQHPTSTPGKFRRIQRQLSAADVTVPVGGIDESSANDEDIPSTQTSEKEMLSLLYNQIGMNARIVADSIEALYVARPRLQGSPQFAHLQKWWLNQATNTSTLESEILKTTASHQQALKAFEGTLEHISSHAAAPPFSNSPSPNIIPVNQVVGASY